MHVRGVRKGMLLLAVVLLLLLWTVVGHELRVGGVVYSSTQTPDSVGKLGLV